MSAPLVALARRLARDCPITTLVAITGGPPGSTDCRIELLAPPDGAVLPDAVIGTTAPPSWSAVGLLAPARVHVAASTTAAPGDPPAERTLAVFVDRRGRVACALGDADGSEPLEAPTGRVLDVCRRLLSLPTPPPGEPIERLWRSLWLDRLAADALADELPANLTELDVRVRHPLARRDAQPPPADDQTGAATRGTSWERLHHEVRTGHQPGAGLGLGLDQRGAAWFDTGSFARWVLAENAPASEALAALWERVGPGGRALVERIVAPTAEAA
ncbi:MAG: hypothetical protein S0880_08490 [Actinomycetota bacterium]|nr:hypothetical protein [Actinomycetota bacterium]